MTGQVEIQCGGCDWRFVGAEHRGLERLATHALYTHDGKAAATIDARRTIEGEWRWTGKGRARSAAARQRT